MLVVAIVRRLILGVFLLFIVCCVIFWVISLMPGDVFSLWRLDPTISPEQIETLKRLYGVDLAVFDRFLLWVKNLIKGDLGYSFYYHKPVVSVIKAHLFPTVSLAWASVILSWMFGLSLATVSVRYTKLGLVMDLFSYTFMSLPMFFLAILILFVAFRWHIFPLGGMHSVWVYVRENVCLWDKLVDWLWHLVLPVLVVVIPSGFGIYRIAVANLRRQMKMPYILYAKAKGLSEWQVVIRYGLWNCAHPLVMMFGYQISMLLSGVLLVEVICDWRGLGMLMWEAVLYRDVFLTMGIVIFSGVMVVLSNLFADILLMYIDPRIKRDISL